MQNKLDQLEMMAEGLFIEYQVDSDFIDDEAVLFSVDSLILQSQVRKVRLLRFEPDADY
jgi:hypothetical protein